MVITAFFAAILGILYFRISFKVIRMRRSLKISYGPGKNDEILPYTSAHSNFSAYVPILLLLLYFLEQQAFIPWYIIFLIGALFTTGRFFHFLGVAQEKTNFTYRVRGMKLTLFPLMIMSVLNLISFIYKLTTL